VGEPAKPGGYLYRELLARATGANQTLMRLLDEIGQAETERSRSRLLLQAALAVAEQRDALAQLREIWGAYRGRGFA
jgi:hypothetical protein